MTVYAITNTKKGKTGIAPTYLHTTPSCLFHERQLDGHSCTLLPGSLNSLVTATSVAISDFQKCQMTY